MKLQDIKYKTTYAIIYTMSLMPWKVMYLISDMVRPLVARYYRRQLVRKQLRESFPNKDDKELREIEHAFYSHFCDLFVEIVKQCSMTRSDMMQRMTFSGHDEMARHLDTKHPIALVMLGHTCNWEWIASLQYWLPKTHCAQVYHPLYNQTSDKLFKQMRAKYGGESITMRQTVRRLLTLHRQAIPTVCGMIADQQPKWDAIHYFGRLLNHDTAVFIGTEQIAKKLDTIVYYASVTQTKRGHYHCHFTPITLTPTDEPDYNITDRYLQLLEADIADAPEQWLWTHKRWTRTPQQWAAMHKN